MFRHQSTPPLMSLTLVTYRRYYTLANVTRRFAMSPAPFFRVNKSEMITVYLGWDRRHADLDWIGRKIWTWDSVPYRKKKYLHNELSMYSEDVP